MNDEQTLQQAEKLLAPFNKETLHPETHRLDVVVTSEDLHAAVTALHDAKWGYLCAITGLDNGPEANNLEALYHFAQDSVVTTLRVRAPRSPAASVPTIAESKAFIGERLDEETGLMYLHARYYDPTLAV